MLKSKARNKTKETSMSNKAKNVKIKVIIEEDKISLREDEAKDFIKKIFNIENAFITDLTELADFNYSGLSPAQYEYLKSLEINEMAKYWDKIILERIKEVYGLELKSVCIELLQVLDLIKEKENPTIQ